MSVVRASEVFIPTLREDPAEAEAASHRLLLRGGFIRQVGAGLFSYLPLGWRVHQKVVQIIREEMNAIGGQEMLSPVLTPAELWEATGRYEIPALFKLTDRAERPFVLAMTHEETFTHHARELQSYKELPQIWYHFGTKDRDEPRPRGGLLRVREFIMKDSYSFDRDDEGLDRSFKLHAAAYRRIFERCGLDFHEVEADVGFMGGSESSDYMAPSDFGENLMAVCEKCDYAADIDIARGIPEVPEFPATLSEPEPVETPGVTTIEEVSTFLEVDPRTTLKAMPVVTTDGKMVLGLVRGDDRLHEEKLASAVGSDLRLAEPDEIKSVFGAASGSIGPVDAPVEVIADEVTRKGNYVAGANRDGWHLRGVKPARDFETRFADIRRAREGDGCPKCGGQLRLQGAIEVGHIFKLGTRYSEPLGATFLDEDGKERPILMGSYGIGPGRIIAAAVEQNYDEDGIIWPADLTPYDVHVVSIAGGSEEVAQAASSIAEDLSDHGLDVLLDDRDRRPGEKFADADLIGAPVRIVVGKKTLADDMVDLISRADRTEQRVPLGHARSEVAKLL